MKNLARLAIVLSLLVMTLGVGATTASAQGSIIHIVRYGETLGTIAAYYGTTVQAIAALNGLYNPNWIYPGQQLIIPATGGPTYPYPQPQPGGVHVVQYGENLFRIGLQYNVPWTTIAALNGIYNPNQIYAGQVLRVPQNRYHTVRYGETLASIAAFYGSNVWAIQSANGLYNANVIYPGQVLRIP